MSYVPLGARGGSEFPAPGRASRLAGRLAGRAMTRLD